MTILKLSAQERRRLTALAVRTTDADVLRRAQALLWLASGHGIEDVTQRLCVCRRTVYYWVEQYEARKADDLAGRLSAMPRSGRPRTAQGISTRSLTASSTPTRASWATDPQSGRPGYCGSTRGSRINSRSLSAASLTRSRASR